MSRQQTFQRAFQYIVSLGHGYDERTRMCVLPGSSGKHDKIIVTHPLKLPVIVDMENKSVTEIRA